MKKIMKNWKTTSAGVLSIAGGILLYVNEPTKVIESLTMLLAGVGLIFATDPKLTRKSK